MIEDPKKGQAKEKAPLEFGADSQDVQPNLVSGKLDSVEAQVSPPVLIPPSVVKAIESDPKLKRRPGWRSSLTAFQYLSSLRKDEEVRIRDSDRSSGIFLVLSCIITLVAMFVPMMAPGRLTLVFLCDVVVGVMLFIYVTTRFGILNTLSKRQALLAWQLLVGFAFMGVFIAINVAVAVAMVVTHLVFH